MGLCVSRGARYSKDAGAGAGAGTGRSTAGVDQSQPSPWAKEFPPLHGDKVACVRWAAPGSFRTWSCGEDKSARLFDWSSGKELTCLMGHAAGVNCMALPASPSRQGLVATASRDRTLRIWHTEQQHVPPLVLEGHTLGVSGVDWVGGADSTTLVSASRDYSVRTWDVQTGKQLLSAEEERNVASALRAFAQEPLVVQTSEDLITRVWDARTLQIVSRLPRTRHFALACDVSHDGLYILTSENGFDRDGCDVKLWDRRTSRLVRAFAGHEHAVRACAFLPGTNATFFSCSKDRVLHAWDANSDLPTQTLRFGPEFGALSSLAVDRQKLAVAGEAGGLAVYAVSDAEARLQPLARTRSSAAS